MKSKLQKERYDRTYRENELMRLELKNMYILQEENKDLRTELKAYSSISYDERMKKLVEENERLKRRNGELLLK